MTGWCATKGRPDQFHDECQRRLDAGLLAACDCPNHHVEHASESRAIVAGQRPNSGTMDGKRKWPESAVTDPGLRPDPAKESLIA